MRYFHLFRFLLLLPLLFAGLLPLGAAQAASGPNVVASIRPVHSLVAGVMEGVGDPVLLVKYGSPHDYSFRPSDAKALSSAKVVFWVGPHLETFLDKPLRALAHKAEPVPLEHVKGLRLLKVRSSFEGHHHPIDPHFWLDPENAKQVVIHVAKVLSRIDPANADVYRANAEYQVGRLNELMADIRQVLASVDNKKLIFYHDAFQYFEKRFGLQSAGFVSTGALRSPGARHVRGLRDKIETGEIDCILTEPQFAPALVKALARNSRTKMAALDPIGADWPVGEDLYFNMMRRNARALSACLKQ